MHGAGKVNWQQWNGWYRKLNPFQANIPSLYPLKTSQNLGFLEYRMKHWGQTFIHWNEALDHLMWNSRTRWPSTIYGLYYKKNYTFLTSTNRKWIPENNVSDTTSGDKLSNCAFYMGIIHLAHLQNFLKNWHFLSPYMHTCMYVSGVKKW